MGGVEQLIKPELLALIPALNFIAAMMKKSPDVADSRIPAALGGIGVVLALCYELASEPVVDLQSGFQVLFTGVTQGLLAASGAVYLHQLKKQQEHKEKEQPPKAEKAEKAPQPAQAGKAEKATAQSAKSAQNKKPPAAPQP